MHLPNAVYVCRVLVALVATVSIAVQAQNFPTKPVTVILPYSPGGIDGVVRMVTEKMSERMGQPFVIDYKPGARSQIGADFVAGARPDGYTLLATAGTTHLKISGAGKTAAWEANNGLAAIGQIALSPVILAVSNATPARNVAELISYVKANPGKLNFASTGYATAGHMAFELLGLETGIKAELIQYKGSGAMNTALLADEVQISIDAATVVPHIRAGRVRGLAIMAGKRSPLFPELPSIAETVPGFDVSIWYGLFTTGGTPASVVNRLNSELQAAVRLPDITARFAPLVLDVPPPLTPAQFETQIRTEAIKWTRALRETSINYQP